MHLLCVCAMRCCFAGHFGWMPKKKPWVKDGICETKFHLTICFFGVFFVAKLCSCAVESRIAQHGASEVLLQRK